MKFLVDAHLPKALSVYLNNYGHESIHTLDLLEGNATSDNDICKIAISQSRTVITKDSDFVDSYMLKNEPDRLCVCRKY